MNPHDGAIMVWVPEGTFLMGSQNRTAYPDEKPVISVQLSGYWMYKYPVTVGQYKKFCQATGHPMPATAPSWGWRDDYPMVNVTWKDAMAYCAWAGVTLPTEAQWEYAARGRMGRLYPWGNSFDASRLWFSPSGRDSAASVHRTENISESPFGIVDMVGNVWQWCLDWYDGEFYAAAPPSRNPNDLLHNPQLIDPPGPARGVEKVLRGGSWSHRPSIAASNFFQASRRYYAMPDRGDTERGFRCVFNIGH